MAIELDREDATQASEQPCHSLFESLLDGVAHGELTIENGRSRDVVYLEVNRAFETLMGSKVVTGKTDSQLQPGLREASPELFERCCRVALTRRPDKFEIYVVPLKVWLDLSVYSPATLQFVAVFADITDRKRAQADLLESEALFRSLFDDAPIAGCMTAADGRLMRVNTALCALLGYSADELTGASYEMLTHPHDVAKSRECVRGSLAGELDSWVMDKRYIRRDGHPVWTHVTTRLRRDTQGLPLHFLTHIQDIDDRRRAEETLQLSEARARQMAQSLRAAQDRLEHVVSSSPVVLYSLDVEGRAFVSTWVSQNIERVLGFTAAQALAPEWWPTHVHPDDLERVIAEKQALFTEGYVEQEYRLRDKNGVYRWIRSELRLLRDEAGNPMEAVGSWTDVTARKETELRLLESEEQYRLLFNSNPHPMYLCDYDTLALIAVNEAAVRHYGYSREEFLRMTAWDLLPPEGVPELRAPEGRIHSGAVGVFRHRRKDEGIVQMEVTRSLIQFRGRSCWLVFAIDVTEKLRVEGQLAQALKMESMGQLAGGIAHDFNNLLGVITGYDELLRRKLDADPRLRRYVDEIGKAAGRAAGLTRQLLAFSRQQVLQPHILDLNVAVGEIEKMLRPLIGEDIELETVLDDHLGQVKADPGQVDQVIINLAVNARDAMPRGGGLTIRTSNVDLDLAQARRHPGLEPGRYVMLAVSDTGHGMTPEVRARIFEPFFTTKDVGKGTGLGLATVHGIAKQSEGHIFVDSEVGRGTTFSIYLPRVDAPEEREETPPIESVAPRGSETVLLVEDDPSLREMIDECLEAAGYTVRPAADGAEALEICEREGAAIDLLVTDVVMPRMSGRELADQLRAAWPGLAVLFMSGYTDDAVVLRGVMSAEMAFVQKPFTTDVLVGKVREILDSRRRASDPISNEA